MKKPGQNTSVDEIIVGVFNVEQDQIHDAFRSLIRTGLRVYNVSAVSQLSPQERLALKQDIHTAMHALGIGAVVPAEWEPAHE